MSSQPAQVLAEGQLAHQPLFHEIATDLLLHGTLVQQDQVVLGLGQKPQRHRTFAKRSDGLGGS